ncbi:uncharacterized protein LOC133824983 [Humulus lupulus]|uniref:uncharacterized protein LOC133824983 n=1 Tax=Humulus lupulus TaxID=3486 RepID=UPI002B40D6AD|nr:uncharacterized protein LOC133824983 [Humulus lupulus]
MKQDSLVKGSGSINFAMSNSGLLRYKDRICVPNNDEIKQVKVERQRPAEQLQPLYVPELKWEDTTMDFVISTQNCMLPRELNFTGFQSGLSLTEDFSESWSQYQPLTEFSYNSCYQSTIGMAPYDMLYGRMCRSPLHWDEVGEKYYNLMNEDQDPDTLEYFLSTLKMSEHS